MQPKPFPESPNHGDWREPKSRRPFFRSLLDKQSVQHRGSDGLFEPYQDIEKETVQVDAATVRTTSRTFGRDADSVKTLVEVIEEEKHTLPGGDSNERYVESQSEDVVWPRIDTEK